MAEMQGDFAEARAHFNRALTQSPNDPATLREIGHFEDRQEHLTLAEQMYRRALTSTPQDPALLNDLALCCARQGRLQESAQLLSNAIALRPEKTLYRNNIAKVLVEIGQLDAARSQLAAAHPPAIAQYNLGALLEAKGDVVAAAGCYREAMRIDPSLAAAAQSLQGIAAAANPSIVQMASAPERPVYERSSAVQTRPAVEPPSEPFYPSTSGASEGPVLALPPLQE